MNTGIKIFLVFLGLGSLVAAGYIQMKNKYVFGTVLEKRCDNYTCSALVEYSLDTKQQAEIETTLVEKGQIIKLEYDRDDATKIRACCLRTRFAQGLVAFSIVLLYVAYFGSNSLQ